jgi:hypothetical protein
MRRFRPAGVAPRPASRTRSAGARCGSAVVRGCAYTRVGTCLRWGPRGWVWLCGGTTRHIGMYMYMYTYISRDMYLFIYITDPVGSIRTCISVHGLLCMCISVHADRSHVWSHTVVGSCCRLGSALHMVSSGSSLHVTARSIYSLVRVGIDRRLHTDHRWDMQCVYTSVYI